MNAVIGIFTISGFTETEAEQTGQDKIQRVLATHFKPAIDVEVYDLRVWKADMDGLAELARRDGVTHGIILGYSWGGGYGTTKLCKALVKRKIHLPLVLLCDPVYRPTWLPACGPANIFGFRALIPRSATITLPEQVARVRGVRQTENIPQGHKIRIGKGPAFDVTLIDRSDIDHGTIDDSDEWQDLALDEIEVAIDLLRSL